MNDKFICEGGSLTCLDCEVWNEDKCNNVACPCSDFKRFNPKEDSECINTDGQKD